MNRKLLKKLQSLTAIVALNSIPVSFADTLEGADSINSQIRIIGDGGKPVLHDENYNEVPLDQLYLQNSLAHIQRHSNPPTSYRHYQYQMALALLEEAYQDGYDDLLDQYENLVGQGVILNASTVLDDKSLFENKLAALKENKRLKLEALQRQFSML